MNKTTLLWTLVLITWPYQAPWASGTDTLVGVWYETTGGCGVWRGIRRFRLRHLGL